MARKVLFWLTKGKADRLIWLVIVGMGVAALLVATGGVTLSARLLAVLPLLFGVVPGVMLVTGDDEEEDETAKTIVAMPAWMSEELQKEKARIEAERATKADDAPPAPVAEPTPAPTPEPPAPEEPAETAQTMAFSPAEAAAFKEMHVPNATEPTPAPAPAPAAEEDLGNAATVMFDAREAGLDKLVQQQPADAPPAPMADELGEDETGAYTAEDVARLKDMMVKAKEGGQPEDDAMAGTMAYMPAMSQEMAEAREERPSVEETGGSKTMAYMPAAGDGASTMAYSPEDKRKMLDAMQAGASPEEAMEAAGASTQAYSPEQSKAMREAFELLDRVKSGAAGNANLQAEAKQLLENAHQTDPGQLREQAQDLLSKTGEMKVPEAPSPAPSQAPLVSAEFAEEKGGMSTATLIVILIVLLALAGGATAFILHFLGIIDLPVDLPQLDLFSKE